MKDLNPKELFEFIRNADTKNLPTLKSILNSYDIKKLSVKDVLVNLSDYKENILLIDARSEKEFNETSLPGSVSFPVLNNSERHNTGLIYKKYSQTSALWLAMQYADPKSDSLEKFLQENDASKKNIYVYCWRGGGRSGYLSKMIQDLGYSPVVMTGGYKEYRKNVNDFFSQTNFPVELLELSGLTGCGKTELLKYVAGHLPVIDLEDAAKHYSSLLGRIPYNINNIEPVLSQTAFENNIYSQLLFINQTGLFSERLTGIIESESKKVGNFEIPKYLYNKIQNATSVQITSSINSRVKRIVKDYFGSDLRGIVFMKNKLIEKETFFRPQLSNKIYEELISLLDEKRVDEFTEIMIRDYYDKKYKDKGKKPIAVISTDDLASAGEQLTIVYNKFLSE